MSSETNARALDRLQPWHGDLLCVAVLVLACLLLRVPSLDRITLNPDESQYEATASYLVATRTPASTLPHGVAGAFGLFKLMTWIFGAYPMFQVRLLVLLICLGMGVLLYFLVRQEANRWCGLLAGLVFLHHVMLYEGLTVNREWFAALMTLVGIALYVLAARRRTGRRGWILFLSGVACGGALWFKLQAAFMVLPVPALLLWQAVVARRPASALRTIGPHFLGGAVSAVGLLLPLYAAGKLGDLLGYARSNWDVMVVGNEQAVQQAARGAAAMYIQRFYWHQPYRLLLLAVFLFSLLCLGAALRRTIRGPGGPRFLVRPGVLIFVAYLVTSLLCVKLGNRFYPHYYLLMLPPVAALAGLAVYHFAVGEGSEGRGRWIALGLLPLLVVDRVAAAQGPLLTVIPEQWPATAPLTLYLLVGLGILAFWLTRPLRRAGPALAALLCLESGMLVLEQQLAETPRTMSHSNFRYPALVEYLGENSRPGDRLFVWGWAPEIYSLTRLESATHVTICQYVVNDYEAAPAWATIDAWWAGMLMRDLEARRPRFIVDAADRSWTSTDLQVYDLARYPDFELVKMLETDYALIGRLDGCDVYERRDGGGSL